MGKQLFKPGSQNFFHDTIKSVYDPAKGFGALLMGNMFAIREFSSPEEKQLLRDAAAIVGEEKTLDAMMKDSFMRVDPKRCT